MTTLRCRLLVGEEARAWAAQSTHRDRWSRLLQRCAGRQPFLSPEFFDVWLRHYGSKWEPILVLGEGADGDLRALMPLARSTRLITGLGSHHAEYQGWLSEPEDAAGFLVEALHRVRQRFPGRRLHLRYLQSSVAGAAVDAALAGDGRVSIRKHASPMLRLDKAAVQASLQKKHTRNHLNRLRREGTLIFEQCSAAELTEAMLDRIIVLYDLRQGAANDSRPFLQDPAKRAFHLDWLHSAPEHFDVTLMRLNDEIIGAYLGLHGDTKEGAASHMAILAYSPFHARNSIGRILLYTSALALCEQERRWLDLTPGGDAWKERFATDHAPALEVVVHGSRLEAWRGRFAENALRVVKKMLSVVGLTPAALRSFAARLSPSALGRNMRGTAEFQLYRIEARELVSGERSDGVRVNCLEDLVNVGRTWGGETASAFLWKGLQRLEAGAHAYTTRGHGGLAQSGWLFATADKPPVPELEEAFGRLGPGAVLLDFVPASRAGAEVDFRKTVRHMLADLKEASPDKPAYVVVRASDRTAGRVLEDLGFVSCGAVKSGPAAARIVEETQQ